MSTETRPSKPGFPISSLLICVGVGLLGTVLPVVVGVVADSGSRAEGGLNALYTVFGLFAATVTGPVAFAIALAVVLVRRSRRGS